MSKHFNLWDNQEKRKVSVEAIKKVGKDWIALCPFHDDRKRPNLSINPEKEVYLCRACGAKGQFYKSKDIIKTYDYKDERGELIYQVVRYQEKGFAQRRPDGKGGWIWNLEGVKRILYNLPEILKSPNKTIFIVEGEKDVENSKKLGILATTNSGGAGKWQSEYNQFLKDREIILIPDNDEPGKKHAKEIGESLLKTVKSIKWLKLPAEEGEDISDWIERGGDLNKLFELVKNAPNFFLPKNNKKTKKKKEGKEKTRTLIPNLIHLVKDNEIVKYLIQNEGKLYIEETYIGEDGVICRPKQNLPIYYCASDILEESREINYQDLLEEIINFIKSYLELSEEAGYLILALWVLHTYLIEKFEVTPILYFYGLKETGKTRAGEVLRELAFRCERLTSPTQATLFRSAEYFKPTLIIDEIKLWGNEGNQEIERLIKSRYKRGIKVNRINMNKSGEDQVEYFDVFGPLVISTTEDIPLIIQDRAIRFLMQKNSDPNAERFIDKKLSEKIRNKLIVFRANYIDKDLIRVEPISRRRLNEILTPLYQILMEIAPDREGEFRLIVKNLEETKRNEEGFSLTASVVEEIVKFYNEEDKMFFSTVELTEQLNEGKHEDEKIKMAKVGWTLKPLGFQKTTKSGKVGYLIELEILNHLIERFNTSKIEPKMQNLLSS